MIQEQLKTVRQEERKIQYEISDISFIGNMRFLTITGVLLRTAYLKSCSLYPLTAVPNEDYPWDVNSLLLQTIVTGEDPGKEYGKKD